MYAPQFVVLFLTKESVLNLSSELDSIHTGQDFHLDSLTTEVCFHVCRVCVFAFAALSTPLSALATLFQVRPPPFNSEAGIQMVNRYIGIYCFRCWLQSVMMLFVGKAWTSTRAFSRRF